MGRETTDQIFFQRLSTGRVTQRAGLHPRGRGHAADVQLVLRRRRRTSRSSRPGACRTGARASTRDLPVDGRGKFEWRGFLKAAKHPQDVSPSDGLLVNWNNKPAKDFPAGDERWDEGGTQRVDWLLAELAKKPKHTPASVLGAANAGATADPRGLMWPAIKAVLDRGTAPSPLATAVVDQITAWSAGDASWVDANLDGFDRRAGPGGDGGRLAAARRRPRCAAGSARTSARRSARGSRPSRRPPSGMYGGWHQYISKDLRTLLGQPVAGQVQGPLLRPRRRRGAARADLWAAIEAGRHAAAQTQGTTDPAQWKTPTVKISFSPLPLVDMQYTNRPSGIHQVMQFAP